jgi:multiple sugar transport system substrate-binding protein
MVPRIPQRGEKMNAKMIGRRAFLRAALATSGALALAACQPKVVEVEKLVKETVVVEKVVEKPVEKVVKETVIQEATKVVEKIVMVTPKASDIKAELRIGGWFDKGTQATVDKQLQMFKASFPNVTVSTVIMDFEPAKSVVMLASGAGPDVFWVNNDQTAPWAARQALFTLDDLIARDHLDMSDFYDVGKFLYSYQGKTYAIAEYLGPLMIMANPLLFEKAGVKLPPYDYKDPSWTLNSLLETAKALTKRTGTGPAEQYGFYVGTSISRWFPFLWDFGGAVMDDWKNPTKVVWDSPETVEALQWIADLRLKHLVTSSAAEEQGLPMQSQFTTGKLAMVVEGGWMWPTFSTPEVLAKVPWEVFPMPRGPKGQYTRMAGDGYGMAARTKYPDLAWELLKHVTLGEGAKVFWDKALCKGMPPTRAMANDKSFLEHFSAGSKKATVELLDYSSGSPMHASWYEVQGGITPPLPEVFTGKRSAKEAVAEGHKAAADVWARVTKA